MTVQFLNSQTIPDPLQCALHWADWLTRCVESELCFLSRLQINNTGSPAHFGHDRPSTLYIWDVPTRVFHWTLVGAVVSAASSGWLGGQWLFVHLVAGSLVAALVIFRLVWGVFGSTYSRFTAFPLSLNAIIDHLGELRHRTGSFYLGHNPLGVAMILAKLAVLTLMVSSGAVALGGMFKQGPLAFLSLDMGHAFREGHEILAGIIVGLVVLHLGGVFLTSRLEKLNLVIAMFTGRKPNSAQAITFEAKPAWPLAAFLVLLVCAGAVGAVWRALPDGPALPPAMAPVIVAECGSCHEPYHPIVLPASVWRQVVAGLHDHFGEDASLSSATAQAVETAMTQWSADDADREVASWWRHSNDPAQSLSITASGMWKHRHEDVPEQIFKTKAVGGKGNCSACHGDARSGVFAPQAIHIP